MRAYSLCAALAAMLLIVPAFVSADAPAGEAAHVAARWTVRPEGLYSPEGNQVAKAADRWFKRADLQKRERRAMWFAVAGVAADIYTTRKGLDRGCKELNPIYGKDPSTGKLVGAGALQLGILYWVMKRDSLNSNHRDGWFVGGTRLAAAAWNSQQECGG